MAKCAAILASGQGRSGVPLIPVLGADVPDDMIFSRDQLKYVVEAEPHPENLHKYRMRVYWDENSYVLVCVSVFTHRCSETITTDKQLIDEIEKSFSIKVKRLIPQQEIPKMKKKETHNSQAKDSTEQSRAIVFGELKGSSVHAYRGGLPSLGKKR